MLIRKIGIEKWQRGFLFMKRRGYDATLVEEKYIYETGANRDMDLGDRRVRSVWVYAIITVDGNPVMITCLLGPEFAWRSQTEVLQYVQGNRNLWLEQDDTTLQSAPIPRREHLIDLLERAVSARALGSPDQDYLTQ